MAYKRPGLTPYHYVQNNPINRFDPDGRFDGGVITLPTAVGIGIVATGAAIHHNYKMRTDPVYREAAISATKNTFTAVKEAVSSFVDGVKNLFSSSSGEGKVTPIGDIPLGGIYIPVKDKNGKIVGGIVVGDPEVKGGAINDLTNKDPDSPDLEQEKEKEEDKTQNKDIEEEDNEER